MPRPNRSENNKDHLKTGTEKACFNFSTTSVVCQSVHYAWVISAILSSQLKQFKTLMNTLLELEIFWNTETHFKIIKTDCLGTTRLQHNEQAWGKNRQRSHEFVFLWDSGCALDHWEACVLLLYFLLKSLWRASVSHAPSSAPQPLPVLLVILFNILTQRFLYNFLAEQ